MWKVNSGISGKEERSGKGERNLNKNGKERKGEKNEGLKGWKLHRGRV